MSNTIPQWPVDLFIDGQWVPAIRSQTLPVKNPATGELLGEVALAGEDDVQLAVQAARDAFDHGPWPKMDALHRGRYLYRIAGKIREKIEEFALTDTLNAGKPIRDTRGFDVPCAADLFESYAGLADKISGRCFGQLPDNVTMQFREPMGVVAAVVPWNFPLTNAAIKLAPALACGNCVVLKPSELTPLSALLLAEIAAEVDLPPGVLNVIPGLGPDAGRALVEHPGIDKITFTGRHKTGESMLDAAKQGIKGIMLELGGKTPSIVFPDAPMDHVINGVITGIFLNLGQVCVAGSRLLVHREIRDAVVERAIAKARSLRQGDPLDQQNHLGSLASALQLEVVQRYVTQAQSEGARLVCGGTRPGDPRLQNGYFYQPTILDDVTPDMTVAREEIFGPVLGVMAFEDEDEAIRLANETDFGLMANIWTADGARALRLARGIQAGRIAINGGGYLRPNVPVFGYKMSGLGAELGFEEAIHEFTNSKAVLYGLSTEKSPWPE